jgi:hypothetical protein
MKPPPPPGCSVPGCSVGVSAPGHWQKHSDPFLLQQLAPPIRIRLAVPHQVPHPKLNLKRYSYFGHWHLKLKFRKRCDLDCVPHCQAFNARCGFIECGLSYVTPRLSTVTCNNLAGVPLPVKFSRTGRFQPPTVGSQRQSAALPSVRTAPDLSVSDCLLVRHAWRTATTPTCPSAVSLMA